MTYPHQRYVYTSLSLWLWSSTTCLVFLASRRLKVQDPSKIVEACPPLGLLWNAGRLKIRTDMLKADIPRNETSPDEVVVHLHVLYMSMEGQVSSKVDTDEIVVVD